MCGITGILSYKNEPVSTIALKRMTDAIAHRGPDGEGTVVDGAIGLGHRRLAIIDLSPAGHQPMATTDGRYILVYNGEVYNFKNIRLELKALGYTFRSRTDSEVVLQAFAEWGVKALDRFNGMFAFAIWDTRKRELTLARDRYGIKPLYYVQVGSCLLFGSEIKAILAHPAYQTNLDQKALIEYFTFQNLFTDRTLFSGVRLLPSGCYLSTGLNDTNIQLHRYWDYNFQEEDTCTDEREYLEELDRLLCHAVNRQLISDVEIGSYLSGGMDSGTVTALTAKQLPYCKTFTAGFDLSSASGIELGFDERTKAERMSYLFQTEHYEMVLKSGDMERILPLLTWHLEEPRVGQSYPNFYVARLASKFCKVVLSGTGGDELFGGYPWRYYRVVVNNDFDQYIEKYYDFWQRLIPNEHTAQVFSPLDCSGVDTRAIFRNVFSSPQDHLTSPEEYINHSLYFEAKTFLHGLLVVDDKLSMASGLETRVPFLDNDLVDFSMKLPVRFKLGNLNEVVRLNENNPGPKTARYFQKTKDGKLILRKAMERHIPREVTDREKQGFSAPDASWFRGESIEYVKRKLYGRDAKLYNFLDRDSIHTLVGEHLRGEKNRRLLIWSLLNFEHWCDIFLDGNTP